MQKGCSKWSSWSGAGSHSANNFRIIGTPDRKERRCVTNKCTPLIAALISLPLADQGGGLAFCVRDRSIKRKNGKECYEAVTPIPAGTFKRSPIKGATLLFARRGPWGRGADNLSSCPSITRDPGDRS
ncbi:hypothetical protein NPIL_262871 [Nephila pilipes]|uniref:Uncharacterized protein n=1 Tax=Nephila pilipes TaxID=299642 RepID=A0A8X6TVU4_NEPPI|nr:hypothetical protein NPIL_262871 [Nephila pilipes]